MQNFEISFFEDDIPEDIRLKNALGINNCEIIENNPQLIVSLTTYPPRINSVHKVIESIFCQTVYIIFMSNITIIIASNIMFCFIPLTITTKELIKHHTHEAENLHIIK